MRTDGLEIHSHAQTNTFRIIKKNDFITWKLI